MIIPGNAGHYMKTTKCYKTYNDMLTHIINHLPWWHIGNTNTLTQNTTEVSENMISIGRSALDTLKYLSDDVTAIGILWKF